MNVEPIISIWCIEPHLRKLILPPVDLIDRWKAVYNSNLLGGVAAIPEISGSRKRLSPLLQFHCYEVQIKTPRVPGRI